MEDFLEQLKRDFDRAQRKAEAYSSFVDWNVNEYPDHYELYVMNRGKRFAEVTELLKEKYPTIQEGEDDSMCTRWILPKED